MKLIKLRPKTPGTRHQIKLSKNLLSKSNYLYKNLINKLFKSSGRSSQTGHITTWHRGKGCKKRFRIINFSNNISKAINITTVYDPFRNSFITLSFDFLSKKFYYFLASHTSFPGTITYCHPQNSELFFGNRSLLVNFYAGNLLYNLSISLENIAKYSRSAGTFSQLLQKSKFQTQVRLPSGKILNLNSNLYASLGRVSNLKYNLTVLGKAGKNRLKGFRSIVRGVAMNPVDHPHGGRTKGGRPSVTPWGILTKGKPTVKKYE